MTEVDFLASAVRFMLYDFDQSVVSKYSARYIPDDVLLSYMRPWAEPFVTLRDLLAGMGKGVQRMILFRRAVSSVALITMKGQPQSAVDFWTRVATGANLDATDGAKRLREYLLVNGAMGSAARGKSEPTVRYFKTVAYCWNKWFDNQPVVAMRIPDGRAIINGCEHVELPRLPEA